VQEDPTAAAARTVELRGAFLWRKIAADDEFSRLIIVAARTAVDLVVSR